MASGGREPRDELVRRGPRHFQRILFNAPSGLGHRMYITVAQKEGERGGRPMYELQCFEKDDDEVITLSFPIHEHRPSMPVIAS